jgi:predicted DNA-binding helix-hairpin-helix protein
MTPPLIREHRLYQADWLIRFYGFRATELTDGANPDLSLTIDPKHAWALRHLEFFPVDVNAAPRGALLRVPGLGVRNVHRIMAARKQRSLRLADLKRLRVPLSRAKAFIVAADWSPPDRDAATMARTVTVSEAAERARESARISGSGPTAATSPTPTLFEAAQSALTGEL